MISKSEIEAKSQEFEIHPANVQRDYVFGWLLFGIFTVSDLQDRIFLKGGNALRKGYLENTRFSSDLDFGTPGDIPQEVVMREFTKVCAFIQEQSGVQFQESAHQIREKTFSATDGSMKDLKVYEMRLYFNDFYGNADHIKIRISIDFTRFDKVILPIQSKQLIHRYSDAPLVESQIRCVKLEEIIATKLKCLLQRQHAPDLFDYVYTIKCLGGNMNRRELVSTFIRKTIFDRNPHVAKEILLKTPFQFFREYWEKTVVCAKQFTLAVEEAISSFISDMTELFSIYPQTGYRSFAYFGPDVRVPIMEAGRSMTCLRITYSGRERLVEPYSLCYMQKRDGSQREYLYVYDRVGGGSGPGIKSLIAENLTFIQNTEEKFEPRFPVELSKAGEMPKEHLFFDPNKPMQSSHKRLGKTLGRTGPQYVYNCAHCGRQFTRSKMSNKLNAHKGKNGYACSGRIGYYVTTMW